MVDGFFPELLPDWYASPMREQQIESCLRRLLDSTELNLDEIEPETAHLIREARMLIESERSVTAEEIMNTLVYVGEQVETLRMVQDLLVEKISDLMKENQKLRQKTLL